MGLRDAMRKKKEELKDRHKEQIDNTDEKGGLGFGSVFLTDKIPDGMPFFQPEKGSYLIDIIPYLAGANHPRNVPEGSLHYVCDIWVYQNVGPGNLQFVSPASNFQITDPISEFIASNRLPKTDWNNVRAKRRTVYLIWDRTSPESEAKGVQIWELAHWFFEKHIDGLGKTNPKGGGSVAFSDIDDGMSIAFTIEQTGTYHDERTGKDKDSMDFLGHQFVPRDDPIPDEIVDQSFALDSIIHMKPTYEEIKEAFQPSTEGGNNDATQLKTPPATDEKEPAIADECPSGYTYGVDTDENPECGPCVNWDSCNDAKEKAGEKETPDVPVPPEPAGSKRDENVKASKIIKPAIIKPNQPEKDKEEKAAPPKIIRRGRG